MFASLRNRLFLTYTLIIAVVLAIVGMALFFYLLRNPAIDRQTYGRLDQVADRVFRQVSQNPVSGQRLAEIIGRIDQQQDARVLIAAESGDILLDSRGDLEKPIQPKIRKTLQLQRGIAWDADGKAWLFVWRRLETGGFLVVAAPRIARVSLLFAQRLREVLRDDLLPPLIQTGLLALSLALVLAFWISHWVAKPLRGLAKAAQDVSAGEYHPVSVKGPKEVQAMSRAFNEMAARVKASQASQREFMANISHDLKTPLTSIQGFAQAILDGTVESPEALSGAAGVIYAEAGRMHRLVLDLLDLTRLEAGMVSLERSPLNLDLLLQRVVEKFYPQAAAARVVITYLNKELPTLAGDWDRLMQVFTNLLDNAIQFTPQEGSVRLEAFLEGTEIRVNVQDTGSGMQPDELPRVFERFYQVDKSRPGGKGRGTGLGLSIASEIVQAHGGSLTVRSQPGQGSVFVVKIPLASLDDTTIMKRVQA